MATAQDTTPINGNLPPGALASSWDPTYNVCRGPDPACYHDWVGPTRQNRVLIYTRTAGPRHASLGPALPAGLNPALTAAHVTQNALVSWLNSAGIITDWTEDAAILGSASLSKYKAIIFASNSRDAMQKHGSAIDPALALNTSTGAYLDAAKVNLRQYIRAGGGFVAIHNAFGTEYNWPWYEGLLGNANYYDHGPFQNGVVQTVNRNDASMAGLPVRWAFKDEWYNLVPYPTNVTFLATVDEASLATKNVGHPGHGRFHPVTWCQYYDGGRAFLTTLGHDSTAWTDGSGAAGQQQFKSMIVNGVKSVMGLTSFCTR
jgi:type 1 glutamine amidotransferase